MTMTSVADGALKGSNRKEAKRIRVLKAPTEPRVKDAPIDILPIVELKPFVRKVWRREKSLPCFYDNYDAVRIQNIKNKEPQAKRPNSLPQNPSPDKTETVIEEIQKETQSQYKRRIGNESPRSKTKMHPPAETKAHKQIEHSQSFVPGFISRSERSKSTLYEIHCEDAPSKLQTGLQRSLERKDVEQPPVINLSGDTLTSSRRSGSFTYLNPFRNHRGHAWTESHETGLNQYLANQLQRQQQEASRTGTPFYDTFDRNGTLPSIQVYPKSLRKDLTKSRGGLEDITARDILGMKSQIHHVGGITNSFHVLSKVGSPTIIEKELTRQLEIDLRRFRRSRNYHFPFDMTPYELAKYYPPPSASMTRGELELRKGLESNTSRKKSRKSTRSAPDKIETDEINIQISNVKENDDVFDDVNVNGNDDDEDMEIHKLTGFHSDTIVKEGSNAHPLVNGNDNEVENSTQLDSASDLNRAVDSRTNVTHMSSPVKMPTVLTPLSLDKSMADDEDTSGGSSEVILSVREANSAEPIDTEVESTRTFITASVNTKPVSR